MNIIAPTGPIPEAFNVGWDEDDDVIPKYSFWIHFMHSSSLVVIQKYSFCIHFMINDSTICEPCYNRITTI